MPCCPSHSTAASATSLSSSPRNSTNPMSARLSAAILLVMLGAAATVPLHAQTATAPAAADRMKVLRAAADALGMVRFSDIGGANTRLPALATPKKQGVGG